MLAVNVVLNLNVVSYIYVLHCNVGVNVPVQYVFDVTLLGY